MKYKVLHKKEHPLITGGVPFCAIIRNGKNGGFFMYKVVIIDDLVATGGTIEAITEMVESLGGEVVKIEFVMELAGLKGRERLKKYNIDSLLIYDGK